MIMLNEKQRGIMKNSPYFQTVEHADDMIQACFKVHVVAKGYTFFRPNTASETVYFLLDGNVRFDVSTHNGDESFIEMAHSGYFFGDLEAVSGLPYRTRAIACEKTEVAAISTSGFLALLSDNPDLLRAFNKQLATNFYFYQMVVAEREVSNLKMKLANLLLSMATRFGRPENDVIELTLSQEELSGMANGSRQRINKQLNEWQKELILVVKYGSIRLLDIDRLRQYASLGKLSLDSLGVIHPGHP